MALSAKDRQEAQALKNGLESILKRLGEGRNSLLRVFMMMVEKETGSTVKLIVDSCFTNEQDKRLRDHDAIFGNYDSRLQTALYNCNDGEYNNWVFRREDFKKSRQDFQIQVLMVICKEVESDAATSTVGRRGVFNLEVTANDRRLLRSMRIKFDDVADEPS